MGAKAPISTSLSQLLVAFTIEVDEEFESAMPHSATVKNGAGLKGGGPWLVSQVMWSNYLRHIDNQGTPVGVLQDRARVSRSTIKSRLNHLEWWGYVTVSADKGMNYAEQFVKLTAGGRKASALFEPLHSLIEGRWRARFGDTAIDELRAALGPFVAAAPEGFPRFMPIVDYDDGMRTEIVLPDTQVDTTETTDDLSTLLSHALLLLTIAFESKSPVSLPHYANVLRVLGKSPTAIKDVPLAAGVSKQAIDASITFLTKAGLVSSDGKGAKALVSLTPAGQVARTAAKAALTAVERSWDRQFSTEHVDRLRRALDRVLSLGEGPASVMAEGLAPHEGSWRSHKNYRPQTEAVLANPLGALPHHPMGLHRGGFPDGS